ncbi:hypothetical protein XELAEV_18005233mg [Xenopus laevis]|uniref:SAM-dependent MTase RsmB/NOP-type domain-containing protein n=1 Tax=Xenopus laevis TaxID=8355 RepID=A0A974I2G2_XENLA|nr:hypothetical protein XELAEV_18005233mg [Xenopus laevis]OCT99452.1 hypothetical protein XELAEV_18005233mg [Xenopus laevis]
MSHRQKSLAPCNSRDSPCCSEKINYPDHIYAESAKIFQDIHIKKPPDRIVVKYGNDSGRPLSSFKDEKSQRWAYELAFNTLKYQDLLETILLDSGFYHSQPLPDEMTSLVMVMLYDFQDKKFQPRCLSRTEETIEEVQEVEQLLCGSKTRLSAALARSRIKHAIPSIEFILPESVRKQEERSSTVPLYAWVNTTKTSVTEVCDALKSEGFTKADSPVDLIGYKYCTDKHCQDVLVFPPYLKDKLNNLELFMHYKLVLQDKAYILSVHSVRAVMNTDDDIIVATPCSGYILAHMSVLTNQNACRIFVCGMESEAREGALQEVLVDMGCKNVKLLKESFTDLDPSDPRLQKAKTILLLPQSSGSGVGDPVQFVLNQHGDTSLLQDFSQGSVRTDKLNALSKQQVTELNHAMTFNKVQALVYCTCSVYHEENEDVINQALGQKPESNTIQTYRIGSPVIALPSSEFTSASDKFIKVHPSETTNGFFLAVLKKEPIATEAVTATDILARAASKGLLDGIGKQKSKKEGKKKKGRTAVHGMTSTPAKISDFLDQENKRVAAQTRDFAKSNVQPVGNVGRKPSRQVIVTPPATATDTSSKSQKPTKPKALGKDGISARIKAHENMVLLQPVKIMLPPVMMPFYSNPLAARVPNPITQYPPRWHSGMGSRSSDDFIAKPRDKVPSSVLQHPKPWH